MKSSQSQIDQECVFFKIRVVRLYPILVYCVATQSRLGPSDCKLKTTIIFGHTFRKISSQISGHYKNGNSECINCSSEVCPVRYNVKRWTLSSRDEVLTYSSCWISNFVITQVVLHYKLSFKSTSSGGRKISGKIFTWLKVFKISLEIGSLDIQKFSTEGRLELLWHPAWWTSSSNYLVCGP